MFIFKLSSDSNSSDTLGWNLTDLMPFDQKKGIQIPRCSGRYQEGDEQSGGNSGNLEYLCSGKESADTKLEPIVA